MKVKTDRLFSLDFIRAFAIIGVVAIHLTHAIYARPDFLGGSTWWLAQSINALSRISIPLFVMLSGYLLLGKSETVSKTLQRINIRLLIPLLAWSVFYMIWNNYWFSSNTRLGDVVANLLSGGYEHLYFLVIMINLYLLLPLLRTFWQNATQTFRLYMVVLTLLFGLTHTALAYFHLDNADYTFVTVGLPYLGYFLAGSLLGDLTLNKRQHNLSWIIWGAATLATALLGYVNLRLFSLGNETFWGFIPYFDSYLSPNVMLAALAGFIALKHARYDWIEKNLAGKVTQVLSATALGLYILHPFVLNVIDRALGLQVDFMSESLLLFLVKRTALVFVLTIVLTLVIQKIPILKKTLGE